MCQPRKETLREKHVPFVILIDFGLAENKAVSLVNDMSVGQIARLRLLMLKDGSVGVVLSSFVQSITRASGARRVRGHF